MNTNDKVIEEIKKDFYQNCFYDVDKAIYGWEEGKGCLMGAFILLSCIIDYLAKFAYGLAASLPGKSGEYYKKFVNEYLKRIDNRYNADDLYHHLRCGLVHHYSTMYEGKAKILFTHDKPGLNLCEAIDQLSEEKRVVLELFQFKSDVFEASRLFFKELETSNEIRNNFTENYNKYGFLTTGIPFEVK